MKIDHFSHAMALKCSLHIRAYFFDFFSLELDKSAPPCIKVTIETWMKVALCIRYFGGWMKFYPIVILNHGYYGHGYARVTLQTNIAIEVILT